MRFAPLSVPLMVTLEGGEEGTVLAVAYGEADTGWPNPEDVTLLYLVSFHGEPRPRLVLQGDVERQRVGR